MKIVVDESPAAASKLPAVASSCLISLVVALGQTSKILSAIAALLIGPVDYNGHYLKVRGRCVISKYVSHVGKFRQAVLSFTATVQ